MGELDSSGPESRKARSRRLLAARMAAAAAAVAAISVLAFGLARGDEWSNSRLPPEKLAIIEQQARFTAGEFDKPGPPLDKQSPEFVRTPEPWPQGIIEDGQAPFLSGTYSFRNR